MGTLPTRAGEKVPVRLRRSLTWTKEPMIIRYSRISLGGSFTRLEHELEHWGSPNQPYATRVGCSGSEQVWLSNAVSSRL
jgi:hypothetical protein